MAKVKEENTTEEMDIEPVVLRKVGGSWTLTVSNAIVKTVKALRTERPLLKPSVKRQDGRTLLIFEIIKQNEEQEQQRK